MTLMTPRHGQDIMFYTLKQSAQQVDVIREHEAVPLLAYAGTLELPLHGPPLPPVYTMTPATDN